MRLNNIRPEEACRFLVNHGWTFYNRKGSHITYAKMVNNRCCFCQVIDNNSTIYWKNVNEMMRKSLIPKEDWVEEFGDPHMKKKKLKK